MHFNIEHLFVNHKSRAWNMVDYKMVYEGDEDAENFHKFMCNYGDQTKYVLTQQF